MKNMLKGSIVVEAIIMLGLIATLTPILYKQVSERREDIENINEANTLLLLKKAVNEYIEANKETLTTKTLAPIDIGIDISGYQIGIRKDSSGKIDALITGKANGAGNDLKAAKIASLLGVSAGIYSAQNTAKAWGINGVWSEDIANYGFSSLPTGIPVITTAYEQEGAISTEVLLSVIADNDLSKIKAEEICLKGVCIDDWEKAGKSLSGAAIALCNAGDPDACAQAFTGNMNRNCSQIANTYKNLNQTAPGGTYRITTSETSSYMGECWFADGAVFASVREVVEGCNSGNAKACKAGYINNLNRTCSQMRTSLSSYGQSAPNGEYKLTFNTQSGQLLLCDMNTEPPWTRVFNGTSGSYTIPSAGTYKLMISGQKGADNSFSYNWCNATEIRWGAAGASGLATQTFDKGTIFHLASIVGHSGGGSALGVYLNSKTLANLFLVGSGGGQRPGGGNCRYYTYSVPGQAGAGYVGGDGGCSGSYCQSTCKPQYGTVGVGNSFGGSGTLGKGGACNGGAGSLWCDKTVLKSGCVGLPSGINGAVTSGTLGFAVYIVGNG